MGGQGSQTEGRCARAQTQAATSQKEKAVGGRGFPRRVLRHRTNFMLFSLKRVSARAAWIKVDGHGAVRPPTCGNTISTILAH